jgi:hypothetical protein
LEADNLPKESGIHIDVGISRFIQEATEKAINFRDKVCCLCKGPKFFRSLFFGHEIAEYFFESLCFLFGIINFLKIFFTVYGSHPSLRVLLLFGFLVFVAQNVQKVIFGRRVGDLPSAFCSSEIAGTAMRIARIMIQGEEDTLREVAGPSNKDQDGQDIARDSRTDEGNISTPG